MTEQTQITAEMALKSRKNFEEFMANYTPPKVTQLLADYPKADGAIIAKIVDLTQSTDTLLNALAELQNIKNNLFITWYVTSEKEHLLKASQAFNNLSSKNNCGIFVFKTSLNGDKMDFECLIKPNPNAPTQSRSRNKESKASVLQEKFWQKYFEICDAKGSDMQINPAPQHWQYIPIGKSGVSINLTVSTKDQYVGCEILINKDKEIFYALEEQKEKIEKELGELDWQELPTKKSSRIRKTYPIDITNEANFEEGATALIKMAEQFKTVFSELL